jgi:hypothetical protein
MSPKTKRAITTRASEPQAAARCWRGLGVLAFLLLTCGAGRALADRTGGGDGLYGKWDSQMQLGLTVGGGAHVAPTVGALVDGGLRLRFLDAFGPVLSFAGAARRRELFTGFELRPFGPMHFLKDRSTGRARRDLFVRSLGLTLGGSFGLDGSLGAAFYWGAGLGVPVLLPKGRLHGLDLRFEARHRVESRDARGGSQRDAGIDLLIILELDLALGLTPVSKAPRRRSPPPRAP